MSITYEFLGQSILNGNLALIFLLLLFCDWETQIRRLSCRIVLYMCVICSKSCSREKMRLPHSIHACQPQDFADIQYQYRYCATGANSVDSRAPPHSVCNYDDMHSVVHRYILLPWDIQNFFLVPVING